jgi:predicted NAD-dependent protein-ADP-ribosyltransferase YbiA (DUF1768 family)
MTNIIELFNPNEKPFGMLSNNSYHPMTINGKKYDTVTNYIYSNMLTTPMFRSVIQNTKIGEVKGVNTELIEAIDFLSKPDTPTKLINQLPKQKKDFRNVKIRYLKRVIGKDYTQLSDKKLERRYKRTQKKVKSGELVDPQPNKVDEESVQQAWTELAKTGNLKEAEDLEEKRTKYQIAISNQVRKPFESIDLNKLKKDLIEESARNQMDIYQIYNNSKEKELFDIISESVHKGFEVRLQNPLIKNTLLGTGNFPIQYESSDKFLGIGSDGKGANIVGKVLMQFRHNFRIQGDVNKRQESEKIQYKTVYDIYLAYMILRKEMFTNKNQLKEYLGMDTQQIINKYGINNLVEGIPSQETITQLYKRDNLNPIIMKELYQPGTMVINVRKTGLRQLRYELEKYKTDIIFNSYLEYMIKKNYDEDVEKEVERQMNKLIKMSLPKSEKNKIRNNIIEDIIARQQSELSTEEINKLRDRIVDLFKLGMLSASLSDRIDTSISDLEIPTDADVEEAELAEIPVKDIVVEKDDISSQSSNDDSSNDSSPVAKMMKNVFKDNKNKLKRSELVDMIIVKKGGNKSDYNDWTKDQLKHELETEEVVPKEKGSLFVQPTGNPIGIFRNDENNHPELRPFNPESYTGMLPINNFNYPTIQHYIISRLIASTGTRRKIDSYGVATFEKGMGVSAAYKAMLVDPNVNSNNPGDFLTIQLAGEVYDKIEQDTNTMLLSMYTVTALNKKFEDRSLQNLLILTGEAEIHWNSTENFYLGIGNSDYPGKNYVGVTLMDIREKIKTLRLTEQEEDIELDDMVKFVNKDEFIMSWVQMRLQDMCGVVYKLQKYLLTKDGIDIDLNEEEMFSKLIKFVLDTVYQPCSSLVELSKNVKTEVPPFFVNMVTKCKGLTSGVAHLTKTDTKGAVRYNKEIEEKKSENERQINQLESEFWGSLKIEHTTEESKEFENHQRVDWSNYLIDLNSSDISQSDKNKSLKKYKETQKNEYNDFWGIETSKKTNQEISIHENEIKELRKEFSEYLRKAERVEKHYFLVMKNMAQIYWNHISVMLSALIQNVKPATASNIRNVLVKVEMLNSENSNCVRIIANENDNCIVSGLLNLLVGIQKFKSEFSGSVELDSDDVELAGSIILNSKFQAKHINPEEPDSDLDLDLEKEEDKFVVSPKGSFPEDDLNLDEDEEENDYGEVENDYEENPYFSFQWGAKKGKQSFSSGDLTKIEQQLLLLGVTSDSKKLSIVVMKTVQKIKNSNISQKIKQNRINFFATIR